MELLDLIKYRRSVRKFQDRQIPREALEKIVEAGVYAPNAGGAQSTVIVGARDPGLSDKLGRLNVACFDRSKIAGIRVSKDQPSIIDDPSIRSAFYGAPSFCVVFARENYPYGVADSFCCAENMTLMATELGIASCIVARAEETFDNEFGAALAKEWGVPVGYVARCFVALGYCLGEYPKPKPRGANRAVVVG